MDYAPNTDEQLHEMLRVIGASSLDELIGIVPPELHQRVLEVPTGLAEAQVLEVCEQLALRNRSVKELTSFLGAGAYDHLIPVVVDALASRGEWLTPYSP